MAISTEPVANTQPAPAWNTYEAACPTRLVLNRIADKWTVLVVSALQTETKRFSVLRKEIGGISQKMLTQTLRGLERDGLVTRTIYPTVPPKVEYALTPLGHTLVKLLDDIRVWAEHNIEDVLTAQDAYDNTEVGASYYASK
jgi:DNA-binding HxlR family transcriptional regulator